MSEGRASVDDEYLFQQLEFRRPSVELEQALGDFFAVLTKSGDDRTFHPHPFTSSAAAERARYRGKDVYCVAVLGGRVLGYGMLRGWDEGYAVPSLGIAIHPESRGSGLAMALMTYLHAEARRRGASQVRLKVYQDNERAIAIYRSLGYEFGPGEPPVLLAFKTFAPHG